MDTISARERERQVKAASPYGRLAGWRLLSFIVSPADKSCQELCNRPGPLFRLWKVLSLLNVLHTLVES